jgi:hypothetical protein
MTMSEIDDLRRELRQEFHGLGRPWYARSPGKEILAHMASVATAIGLGFAIHRYTGETIAIEAKRGAAPDARDPASELLASAPADSVVITYGDGDEDAAAGASAKTVVVMAPKHKIEVAVSSAAPSPAVVPAAAAQSKRVIVRETTVGGRDAL